MKCKHTEYTDHLRASLVGDVGHVIHVRTYGTCLAQLPLGPANDDDPRVQCEIRAAEIVDALERSTGQTAQELGMSSCEVHGFGAGIEEADIDLDEACRAGHWADGHWAGWFAAHIASEAEMERLAALDCLLARGSEEQ